MRREAWIVAAALVSCAPSGAAAAATDLTLDRYVSAEQMAYELTAFESVPGEVAFGFSFARDAEDAEPESLFLPLPAAGPRLPMSAMAQPIDCTSVVAVAGTVIARARSAEAVLDDGRIVRLPLRRTPWRYRGRAFGALLDSVVDVAAIRARDGRRRLVSVRRLPPQRDSCDAVTS